jgi:hypothetical protein
MGYTISVVEPLQSMGWIMELANPIQRFELIVDNLGSISLYMSDRISYFMMEELVNYFKKSDIPNPENLKFFIDTFSNPDASNGVVMTGKEALETLRGLHKILKKMIYSGIRDIEVTPMNPKKLAEIYECIGTLKTCLRQCITNNNVIVFT